MNVPSGARSAVTRIRSASARGRRRSERRRAVRSGVRVLCVEDSKTIGDLQRLFLESAGYEVLVAEDGNEACQLLSSVGADVLVTDQSISGWLGHLRASSHAPPVVLVFGSLESLARVELEQLPVAGWLVKPYSQRQLVSAVQSALASLSGRALRKACLLHAGVQTARRNLGERTWTP